MALLVLALACSGAGDAALPAHRLAGQLPPGLEVVHESKQHHFTGVAVSGTGRIFVSLPRLSDAHALSVAELHRDGRLLPFPDVGWNAWDEERRVEAASRFVCVQSLVIDDENVLWVLDSGSPRLAGVIEGAAKLVGFDLTSGELRSYPLPAGVAPPTSVLSDVQVDAGTRMAYITDSGLGALVVLDLATGRARRLLAAHPSVKAEPGVVPVIAQQELRGSDGGVPEVHSEGIALDATRSTLYFRALTAKHLYAIDVRLLNDPSLDDATIGSQVRDLGETVVSDGMTTDGEGNVYLSAVEVNAIIVHRPDGRLETVVADPRIAWPDSFAWDADGRLYFTASQAHLSPRFAGESGGTSRIFRLSFGAAVPAMPEQRVPMPMPGRDPNDGLPSVRLASVREDAKTLSVERRASPTRAGDGRSQLGFPAER